MSNGVQAPEGLKERARKETKEYLDRETIYPMTISYGEAKLFYDLLIKDIKEDKEMESGKLINELAKADMPVKIVTLSDTEDLMKSADYKKRFVAEYYQTKIRYEKLKAYNTKIEAARRTREPDYMGYPAERKAVEEPRHDCPVDMLRTQQGVMGEYLHILEVRAVIEGIDLDAYK